MGRRKKRESGIHLYEAEHKNRSGRSFQGGPVLILVQSVLVCLLAVSWWRAFFDVFPAEIKAVWLYVFLFPLSVLTVIWATVPARKKCLLILICGIPAAYLFWRSQKLAAAAVNYLANAYLRIHNAGTEPLLLYEEPAVPAWTPGFMIALASVLLLLTWSVILVKNKGKILAVLLVLFPPFLAAVEGYFPSAAACWLLIFAAGLYFSVCGGSSGKSALRGAASAFVCLMLLFLASNAVAKPVEAMKTAENGVYRKARTAVKEGFVQKFADLTGYSDRDKADQEESRNEADDKDGQDDPNGEENAPEDQPADSDETQAQDAATEFPAGTKTEGFLAGGTQDLKAIASFSPGNGEGLIIQTDVRPQKTFYYPEEYGSVYNGDTWGMESLSDAVLPNYSQYPSELKRLVSLCRGQDIDSIEDAARFIQAEFKENTVYDYHPGATPEDQDFAEYFLFENKKGFCVHFATTATLMYRILGYPARYAEGYAVPASAFQEQEDGTYTARVTGQMGHAWCETYEDGWQIREHTLPYLGDDTQAVPPASDSKENAPAEVRTSTRILTGALTLSGLLVLLMFIFLLQAAVRRKKRWMQCRRYRQGRGVLALYQSLYDTAVFLGMEKTEDTLSTKTFESVKNYITEISVEDWQWIQDKVWQSMFAQSPPSREEHDSMFQMVNVTARKIRHDLTGWKRIKYRQIACLG